MSHHGKAFYLNMGSACSVLVYWSARPVGFCKQCELQCVFVCEYVGDRWSSAPVCTVLSLVLSPPHPPRLLSDPHRTKHLGYFSCLGSCLFLCASQATGLSLRELTTALQHIKSTLFPLIPLLTRPFFPATSTKSLLFTKRKMKWQRFKSINVIFKNGRLEREKREEKVWDWLDNHWGGVFDFD